MRVLPRLRPMRTRGPENISSSPRRGPLRYRNRRGRTLLLADRILGRCRTGELNHRELVLHFDHRAAAGLLLARAELRAGVRIDQRFANVDHVELVAHFDAGGGAKVDEGALALNLDDLAFDAT